MGAGFSQITIAHAPWVCNFPGRGIAPAPWAAYLPRRENVCARAGKVGARGNSFGAHGRNLGARGRNLGMRRKSYGRARVGYVNKELGNVPSCAALRRSSNKGRLIPGLMAPDTKLERSLLRNCIAMSECNSQSYTFLFSDQFAN